MPEGVVSILMFSITWSFTLRLKQGFIRTLPASEGNTTTETAWVFVFSMPQSLSDYYNLKSKRLRMISRLYTVYFMRNISYASIGY